VVYQLAKQGSVFSTRPRAVRLLAHLHEVSDLDTTPLVLDFQGVRDMSYSFADEFIGTLTQRAIDEQVEAPQLINMEAPVCEMVSLSLASRELPLPAQARVCAAV